WHRSAEPDSSRGIGFPRACVRLPSEPSECAESGEDQKIAGDPERVACRCGGIGRAETAAGDIESASPGECDGSNEDDHQACKDASGAKSEAREEGNPAEQFEPGKI